MSHKWQFRQLPTSPARGKAGPISAMTRAASREVVAARHVYWRNNDEILVRVGGSDRTIGFIEGFKRDKESAPRFGLDIPRTPNQTSPA
jgi:hypothetical protein